MSRLHQVPSNPKEIINRTVHREKPLGVTRQRAAACNRACDDPMWSSERQGGWATELFREVRRTRPFSPTKTGLDSAVEFVPGPANVAL